MADALTGIAEVDATRQELILEIVQRELSAAAKVAPLVRDVSMFAEPGNKQIDFPRTGSYTVEKLGLGIGTTASAQANTYVTDDLLLDQHATVQFLLKKRAEVQSKVAVEMDSMMRAASAHARALDEDIIEELASTAAVANDVIYAPGTIEDNILESIQKLDEQNAPEENRFLLFRPAQKKILLGVDNFVQADKYGDRTPIFQGEIGQAYGVRFVMSNISTTTFIDGVMLMFQQEGLAWGRQFGPEIDEEKDIKFGAGSKRVAMDQIYGVKALQGGVLTSKIA